MPKRLQSAYAFLATILPFSTSRSRTRSMSKRSRRPWKPSARFSKSMNTARERSPSGINPLGKDGRRLKREGARVDLIILLRAGYRGKHLQSNWLIHDDVAKLHLQ